MTRRKPDRLGTVLDYAGVFAFVLVAIAAVGLFNHLSTARAVAGDGSGSLAAAVLAAFTVVLLLLVVLDQFG